MKRVLALAAFLVFALPASATTSRILAPMDWWPVWSPDGAHVAFTRVYPNHMQLGIVDVRTNRVSLAGTNTGQLFPTWSDDGRQLAYASGGVLWIVTAGGAGKHRYVAPLRSFAPAWRPHSLQLAYLTTRGAQNTDLWVGGALWARHAIGRPAWSPDGSAIAFQRDDGIYVATAPGQERQLASIANPGPPAWSHDGKRIAYGVTSVVFVAPADGSAAPKIVANALGGVDTPSWSADDVRLAVPFDRGVSVVRSAGGDGQGSFVQGASGPGASYGRTLVASGARTSCPGHIGIAAFAGGGKRLLTGSCLVTGTSGADVIEGTPLWGDVIVAGAGNDSIHSNDGHTDRVDCGPGRDTVWADRTDRLSHCEVIHR